MTKIERKNQIRKIATQLHRIHLIYHHANTMAKFKWYNSLEWNQMRRLIVSGELDHTPVDVIQGIQWLYQTGRLDGTSHMKLRQMNIYHFLKLVAEISVELHRPTNAEVRDWMYANFCQQ